MVWRKYDLCFRLLSSLHIGYLRVGNLMQTRGYVPGKNLWAALTARLTRDHDNGSESRRYQEIGRQVQENFRFTYLYPALPKVPPKAVLSYDDLKIYYPWEEKLFDYLFLDSCAGTALNHDLQVADEGLLRETEFIRPWARALSDDAPPQPVYLMGSVYVRDSLSQELSDWPTTLENIQLGGERGYGWGRLRLEISRHRVPVEVPVVTVRKDEFVQSHVLASGRKLVGPLEPLVGWERDNKSERNWRLSEAKVCYAPGALVKEDITFTIGVNGIWE